MKSTPEGELKEPETGWRQFGVAWKEWCAQKQPLETAEAMGENQCCAVLLEARAREFTEVARRKPQRKRYARSPARGEGRRAKARPVTSLRPEANVWSRRGQGEAVLPDGGGPQPLLVYPLGWPASRGESPIELGDSGFPPKHPSGWPCRRQRAG